MSVLRGSTMHQSVFYTIQVTSWSAASRRGAFWTWRLRISNRCDVSQQNSYTLEHVLDGLILCAFATICATIGLAKFGESSSINCLKCCSIIYLGGQGALTTPQYRLCEMKLLFCYHSHNCRLSRLAWDLHAIECPPTPTATVVSTAERYCPNIPIIGVARASSENTTISQCKPELRLPPPYWHWDLRSRENPRPCDHPSGPWRLKFIPTVSSGHVAFTGCFASHRRTLWRCFLETGFRRCPYPCCPSFCYAIGGATTPKATLYNLINPASFRDSE